jgi:adenylate kinase
MRVARQVGLAHIATGDLFRQALEKRTPQALRAKPYMEAGRLVPDEITIAMVLERLSAPDCRGGVIFDGFPRNLRQAEALDSALDGQGSAIDRVVFIKVREQVLVERLSGRWICRKCQAPYHALYSPPGVAGKCDRCGGELYQRADDTAETVKKRLVVYETETAPLIEYYLRKGKLVEVNGEGDEEEVERRIVEALRREPAGPKGK